MWIFNDQDDLETGAVSDWTADLVRHDARGRRLRLVIDRHALLFVPAGQAARALSAAAKSTISLATSAGLSEIGT